MMKANISSVKFFTQKKLFFCVFLRIQTSNILSHYWLKYNFFVRKVKTQFLRVQLHDSVKIWRLVWESSTIQIIPSMAKCCAHHPSVPLPHVLLSKTAPGGASTRPTSGLCTDSAAVRASSGPVSLLPNQHTGSTYSSFERRHKYFCWESLF